MSLSIIALRALNEYRRISPFTYLSLRYYLLSEPAQNIRWARTVAPGILLREDSAAYFRGRQYKQSDHKGKKEFRDVCYPCANEAMTEAALLWECALAGDDCFSSDDVFSYRLAPPESHQGSFVRYFKHFAERQAAIGKVCRKHPNDVVLYVDIKRFYPSVTSGRAKRVWRVACKEADIDRYWRSVGNRLLLHQKSHSKGLLVGPMFSHLVGNLILRDLDRRMRRRYRGRYFRYVDDIALVIPEKSVPSAKKHLQALLKHEGLKLNRKKTFTVSAMEWHEKAPHQGVEYDDPEGQLSNSWWFGFVDKIKCFLMTNPQRVGALADAFRDEEIRIALPQYEYAINRATFMQHFAKRLKSKEFRHQVARLSVERLLSEAIVARELYLKDFNAAWKRFPDATGLERKWLLSQLRYLLGRLILLAPNDQLSHISDLLASCPDLTEYRKTFDALARRDVSELIGCSGKVSAAVGQALATTERKAKCIPKRWNREAVEGYATMLLLGVKLYPNPPERIRSRYPIRLLNGDYGARDWHSTPDKFYQELFALAGQSKLEAHHQLMTTPIDPDEGWVLFADELSGISS